MRKDHRRWRDVNEEVAAVESLGLEEVDTALKEFWSSGKIGRNEFKDHVMHLAHGYSHAICVANLSREMAEKYGVSGKNAFVAGLLHDAYREIRGEGTEPHGRYCAEVAQAILKEVGGFHPKIISSIVNAIKVHDLSDKRLLTSGKERENALREVIDVDLNAILFVADKSHMNIERVMSFAYDCDRYANDPTTPKERRSELKWFNPSEHLAAMDIALFRVARKFSRDGEVTAEIDRRKFGEYCSRVFEAWENTIEEIQSQRDKESRKDDYSRTLMLFWAFKEAISNFRYLVASEKTIYGRRGDDLWAHVNRIMGERYNALFLTELGDEPFQDILQYRLYRQTYEGRK